MADGRPDHSKKPEKLLYRSRLRSEPIVRLGDKRFPLCLTPVVSWPPEMGAESGRQVRSPSNVAGHRIHVFVDKLRARLSPHTQQILRQATTEWNQDKTGA